MTIENSLQGPLCVRTRPETLPGIPSAAADLVCQEDHTLARRRGTLPSDSERPETKAAEEQEADEVDGGAAVSRGLSAKHCPV